MKLTIKPGEEKPVEDELRFKLEIISGDVVLLSSLNRGCWRYEVQITENGNAYVNFQANVKFEKIGATS